MKIAVTGASGRAGSRIAAELALRGHAVTAIARNPERIASLPNVTARKGDVFDQAGMAALWSGHDAAVSSVHFLASDPGPAGCRCQVLRRRPLPRGWRGGQPGGCSRRAAGDGARLSRAIQGGSGEGRGLPRPVAGRKRNSTGPSCRPRRCSPRGSGPASSGSATTSC